MPAPDMGRRRYHASRRYQNQAREFASDVRLLDEAPIDVLGWDFRTVMNILVLIDAIISAFTLK